MNSTMQAPRKRANTKWKSEKKEDRKFESKYGYFTHDGKEYVVTRPDTPRPWVNVICNGDYGMVESQNGSGFSWRTNSNLSRITRWEQDLIRDSYGKYIYVRDNDSGNFWSATYKPCCPKFDFFEVRHGFGYSILTSVYDGIRSEKTVFVDRTEPAEVWRVIVRNESTRTRNISLFSYFEWCLGNAGDTHREFQKTFIETSYDEKRNALWGLKRAALVPGFISTGLSENPLTAFHALANIRPDGYEGAKENFFGRYEEMTSPESIKRGTLSNTAGKHFDSIASLQSNVILEPGDERTFIFILGCTERHAQAERVIKKLNTEEKVEKALTEVKTFWDDLFNKTLVETPDESLNFMTNGWLKYQAISARIWAKCGYYQSSGGYGFRDQLQDSHIFLPLKPEWTKKQILMHAEQQFPDGTVHHWWHHGTKIAAVTHMTDDLLWLAFLTMHYLEETADFSILKERIKFLPDPRTKKVIVGTLYDHCLRSIDRVLARWSKRGLPLIGEGDWNDGMSHVGLKWKGESIWLGHFLYGVLRKFSCICEMKRDKSRAIQYRKRADKLKKAINQYGWDGEWYIRATRDDGRPLGSKSQKEGKIFLNAQTWAIIQGTATPERAKQCLAACDKFLFKEHGPLLFTPAYSKTDPTIGYLSRYAPGVRENGGLYTHAGTWAIQALAMMKQGNKAHRVYQSFMPVLRGKKPDLYYAEPYVLPGNVDGPESGHCGRGAWTWYTGSASWYFRVALDYILGVHAKVEGLEINPCIPKKWDSFKVKRFFRGATYDISVKNPNHVSGGVKKITVNGKVIEGNVIKTVKGKGPHKVAVLLG
jgi:cellobiose phosphorylase